MTEDFPVLSFITDETKDSFSSQRVQSCYSAIPLAERSDGTDDNEIMRTRTAEENSLVRVLKKEKKRARERRKRKKSSFVSSRMSTNA